MLRRPKPFSHLALRLLQSPHLLSSHPQPLQTLAIPSSSALAPSSADRPTLPRASAPRLYPNPVPVSVPAPVSTPDAESICVLLSDAPVGSPRDLDALLVGFEQKLTSALVLEVLKCYRRLGRCATLEFFSWAGVRLGFRFEDHVVEYMADFLGRRKLFDDLKWLLRTVAHNNGRVSSRSVSICIRFLGMYGRVAEALALFEVMELELKCLPDDLVFNNLLYVICKKEFSSGSIDVAFRIFHRIMQPDVYSYSNMIIGLCRFGRLESAFQVFHEMGRANLAPTRTVANALIKELCGFGGKELVERVNIRNYRRPYYILIPNLTANGFLGSAVEVFWTIARLGLLPSWPVVDALVGRLCEAGKIEEAIKVTEAMEDRKPNHVAESYSIVIRALCVAHRMDEACNLFGKRMNLGWQPKLVVYNSMIQAFCESGNVSEAQKYFEIMNKKRCEPDYATYTMLIHANCMIQNWQGAYKLLMEMIGLGWCPHSGTYNLVEGYLKKNREFNMSINLRRKMELQDLYAHCKAGRLEAAYDKLSSMLAVGFHPPIYVRDAFECAFQRSSKWSMAQDLLKKINYSPNSQVKLKLEQ